MKKLFRIYDFCLFAIHDERLKEEIKIPTAIEWNYTDSALGLRAVILWLNLFG